MTTPLGLQRICSYLSSVKTATVQQIAEACHICPCHVRRSLQTFSELGLAYKAGHKRREGVGGTQIHVWARGCEPNAEPLPREPSKVLRKRRVEWLRRNYGTKITNRILASRSRGGSDKIIVEGVTIYERGKPRGVKA